MSNIPEVRTFDLAPPKSGLRRRLARFSSARKATKRLQAEAAKKETEAPLPERKWSTGGRRGRHELYGLRDAAVQGISSTAHTSATAFPWVAGPSLGLDGVWIGHEEHGGGAFNFDPFSLYAQQRISGLSMLVFGTVGSGKSSLVKSLSIREVLAGRKLAVPSDLKGEWVPVIRALGGAVIRVAPGMKTRLNILDEGVRPRLNSQGEPMTDENWAQVVRQRRMTMLSTVVLILRGSKELDEHETFALEDCLGEAVEVAEQQGREVTTPDVRRALDKLHQNQETTEEMRRAADRLRLVLGRLESGDLAGMFDGPSTERLDGGLPAVGIDTSALRYSSPTASRIVSACCGAWMEAMISEDDGQRIVVYEEGWDSIANEADLKRMQTGWKLARHLGIFNILILHKVDDLKTAGGEGSQMAAIADGLLAEADVKVIYRQDNAALQRTDEKLQLTDRERSMLRTLKKGRGLWRVKDSTFEVRNVLTAAEKPLLNTDQSLGTEQEETTDAQQPSRGWVAA